MNERIDVHTVECTNKSKITFIILNSLKTLNAQDTDMVKTIKKALLTAMADINVACIVLSSSSTKAFCAGGDVVKLHHYQKSTDKIAIEVDEFFTHEYELVSLIHHCEKPILSWSSGITMGGGLGLVNGASHRVVTETTRMAMPEISIGLIPDVGATYFLTKMPDKLGLFFALCAYKANAEESIYLNLADFYLKDEMKNSLFKDLSALNWQRDQSDHLLLNSLLVDYQVSKETGKKTTIEEIAQLLTNELTDFKSIEHFQTSLENKQNILFDESIKTLQYGSRISAQIIVEQFQVGKRIKTIEEALAYEYEKVCFCCTEGDFIEGVRALLIDRDKKPKWKPPV